MGFLAETRNCWRVEDARRVSFLVDGSAYFSAFMATALRAERFLGVLGWDTESAVDLAPDPADPLHPAPLGAFLHHLLERQPGLHIHILTWDFSFIYTLERELFTPLKFNAINNPRLRFHRDHHHPTWASHHQKMVVVDDRVAFSGGMDLCRRRWDTSDHHLEDPRRIDPRGIHYGPFHDVQIMVEGPVATALGEMFRERWFRATGQPIPPPRSARSPWPDSVKPDVEHATVGISRTLTAFQDLPEIREVEALHLDTIARAQRYIYIENQYFSCPLIADALARRLAEPHGPDVILVLPVHTSGWMERSSMEVFVVRLLEQLRAADAHGRLGVFHPPACMQVHSKVCIADDALIRVGSANLNNRSLGVDSECDLTVDGTGSPHVHQAARAFLCRLLAEHMRLPTHVVEQDLRSHPSVLHTVTKRVQAGCALQPFTPQVPAWLDRLSLEPELSDPHRPFEREEIIAALVPPSVHRPIRLANYALLSVLTALVALAITWPFNPLVHHVDPRSCLAWLSAVATTTPWYLVMLPMFLLASLVMVPVVALNFLCVVVLGPVQGFLCAMLGSCTAAAVEYGLGSWMRTRGWWPFRVIPLDRIRSRFLARGALTAMAIRVLPLAPFTLVNLVAGGARIHFGDFMTGTLLGMMPGIMAMVVLRYGLEEALLHPSLATHLLLAAVAMGVLVLFTWAHARIDAAQPRLRHAA